MPGGASLLRHGFAVDGTVYVRNADESTRTRLMNVALMAFNVLRPRGRSRFGMSAGILGNGFGLSRACLERVPYTARSVVEDLEHHLELVKDGMRVEFVDDTWVKADFPVGERGADTQRARWEGGRFRMVREHAPRLLGEIVRGRAAKWSHNDPRPCRIPPDWEQEGYVSIYAAQKQENLKQTG